MRYNGCQQKEKDRERKFGASRPFKFDVTNF